MNARRLRLLLAWLVFSWGATIPAANAAAYPARPVRFIVPSAPGGTPDIISRVLAAELSKQMGQQVVADNRPGAGGVIGMHMIARGAPDGYTIGYGPVSALAVNPSVMLNTADSVLSCTLFLAVSNPSPVNDRSSDPGATLSSK